MDQTPAKCSTRPIPLTRFAAFFMICALLAPLFLIGRIAPVSAQTAKPKTPAQKAAPPLTYDFSSNSPGWYEGVIGTFSENTRAAIDYVTVPELPEGFENAKPVSPFYKSVSSSIESIFSYAGAPKVSASTLTSGDPSFDYDGDGKADHARWHPATSDVKIKKSNGGAYQTETIGTSSYRIVPGDFDGDNKTDVAVFSNGTWKIRKSSGGSDVTHSFGTSGDIPVVGDYDGGGKSDYAIFRPSTNTWWIQSSETGAISSSGFGAAGDITAQGNYDGDTKTDIAVFRPSTGVWHVLGSAAGYYTFNWGIAADMPVPADYDADGKTDFAVFRPTTGTWWVYESSGGGSYLTFDWGNYGDQPVPADYDGDNKADYAVWRPTTGVWHIHKSTTGTFEYETLGMNGDTPAQSAYLKQVGSLQSDYDFAKDRLSPINATGGTNLYSRNFSWGTELVSLAGRAGLHAGIGISYNSLVWIKDTKTNTMVFDPDASNVAPGFRLGFATIDPVYWDKTNGRFSYLMVTPSGARVEFQQIGATNQYETQDSTYALLETVGASHPNDPVEDFSLKVITTDGTRTKYEWKAGAFRASKIKDRNGNLITIDHDDYGLLRTVTDTLGRVITVNYDAELYPTSITQQWKNSNGAGSAVTHTYATFTYTDVTVNPSFSSSVGVFGPDNGTKVKSLLRVWYGTTSSNTGRTDFHYNAFGQVRLVYERARNGQVLNYTLTSLTWPGSNLTDVPRLSNRQYWTRNFNLVNGATQRLVVTNTFVPNQTIPDVGGTGTKLEVALTGHPTGNKTKMYVGGSGWKESLPILSEDWADSGSGLQRKRWRETVWTQDDTGLNYIKNPRVTETRVGDDENGQVRRSTTDYRLYPSSTVAEYGLVESIKVYDSDQSTVLKEVQTDYNLSSVYTSRRIIGLPSEVRGYGFENSQLALVSKLTYQYDGENFTKEPNQIISPINHQTVNYGSSFVSGRGNLTSITRHDVTGATSAVTSKTRYDIAGSPVASLDPLGRKIRTEYTDSFNDNINRSSFAYPTKIIDPNNQYSQVEYRYDFGANVWADSPQPSGSGRGRETTREYDSLGRLTKQKLENTGAYTRYTYPSTQTWTNVYTTVVDTNGNGADSADEVLSVIWTDGAGRVIKTRTEHPGSTGGYAGTLAEYDKLGQLKRSTVPTEVTSSVVPAGDDAAQGWLWNEKEYDWNGRVTREINTDGTDRLISYEGCGCAGGMVTTIKSELVPRDDQPTVNARRTQKVYTDILGRTFSVENYDWDDDLFSKTLNTFNGRDQIVEIRQQDHSVPQMEERLTSTVFDGFGRIVSRKEPQQTSPTLFEYFPDSLLKKKTDARGATENYLYNNLGLPHTISFTAPSGITNAKPIQISYDNAGNVKTANRVGFQLVTYDYDDTSRLTRETTRFANLGSGVLDLTVDYEYNLGVLESVKDPDGNEIVYNTDKTGRTVSVTGSYYGTYDGTSTYISSTKYRAWGDIKELQSVHGIKTKTEFNTRRLPAESVMEDSSGTELLKRVYSYNDDGRISANDGTINGHSRAYKYDHIGRLSYEKAEEVGSNPLNTVYEYSYSINAFGENTYRLVQTWGENNTGYGANETFQISDGRVAGWTYDADGRATRSYNDHQVDPIEHSFSSDGSLELSKSRWESSPPVGGPIWQLEVQSEMSAGGQLGKRTTTTRDPNYGSEETSEKYFVYSSVLGQTISEIDGEGRRINTFVIAFGDVVAALEQGYDIYGNPGPEIVKLDFKDSSGQSRRKSTPTSSLYDEVELTPEGTNVWMTEPEDPQQIQEFSNGPWDYFPAPTGCIFDGASGGEQPCTEARAQLDRNYFGYGTPWAAQFRDESRGFSSDGVGGSWHRVYERSRRSEKGLNFFLPSRIGPDYADDKPKKGPPRPEHPDRFVGNMNPIPIYCDPDVIAAMNKAWNNVGVLMGRGSNEQGFTVNGTFDNFQIDKSAFTNQRNKLSITISNKTIALFHSHPDGTGAKPSINDRKIADANPSVRDVVKGPKQKFSVYTFTSRGLFVYDPFEPDKKKRTRKLRDGTEWKKPCPPVNPVPVP